MVSVCSNPAHNENSEENLIATEYAHAYNPCEDESLAFEALKLHLDIKVKIRWSTKACIFALNLCLRCKYVLQTLLVPR